jgi:threonine/homoserine/homoserine lactone efflux protein
MKAILAFSAAVSVLIAIPGPSVLFTVGRALSVGRRGALLTAVGGPGGAYMQVIAVALGLGAIVESSVEVYTLLKLAGAAYLFYLGAQAIRHHRALTTAAPTAAVPMHTLKVLREGFIVGATNPKMTVFLVAALPQFVDRSGGQPPLQMLLLGLVVPVIALVSDSLWALAAGTAPSWLSASPRRAELLSASGGLALVSLGVGVALSGRKD